MSLSAESKSVIKSTIPVLQTRGTEIIQVFYQTLFTRYPSVKRQFNMDRQSADTGTPAQVTALARAVLLYAQKIDKLPQVLPLLRPIAEKHVSRGVSPEQYDAVGECLLAAMEIVLGDAVKGEILGAWGEAYGVLKDVFVEMEREIRENNERHAGWQGMKQVSVGEVMDRGEGRVIRLLVEAGECRLGMFVSVIVDVDGTEMMTSLQIVEVCDDGFSVVVEGDGRCAKELNKISTGENLSISVPCGMPN